MAAPEAPPTVTPLGSIHIELPGHALVSVGEWHRSGTCASRSWESVVVIELKTGTRIRIAGGFADLRRGFQGLSSIVETALEQALYSGYVFVFRGKRGGLIRLLGSFWVRAMYLAAFLGLAAGDEAGVEQRRFVVEHGVAVEIGDAAAGDFKDALRGGGVPLHGGAEAGVNVGGALGYEAELERTAHGDAGMGTGPNPETEVFAGG